MKRILLATLAFAILIMEANAKVSLPSIIGDNMVLQQHSQVKMWGWTSPGKNVVITASWDNKSVSAKAGSEGLWEASLFTPPASMEQYTITFNDGDIVEVKNVLCGEVWVCSGQSNMNMPVGGFNDQPVEGAFQTIMNAPSQRQIRMATISKKESASLTDEFYTHWEESTPSSVRSTSAVAYYFAEQLSRTMPGIPIGIISTSWGGTQIQLWLPQELFFSIVPKEIADKRFPPRSKKPTIRGGLYNAMIYPISRYSARGFLWYQGESNVFQNDYYGALYAEMVKCWRESWGDKEAKMPFYCVQLAPYKGKASDRIERPLLVDCQVKSIDIIPNSYVAATTDIGEELCIHPVKKREVGERLAAIALNRTYGFSDIPYQAPRYESCTFEEGKAIISFKDAIGGLSPRDEEIIGFEIAGENRVFYKAKAMIIPGKISVEVSSPMVSNPVAVRYAYRNYIKANLKSIFGIPAYSFRTDSWE